MPELSLNRAWLLLLAMTAVTYAVGENGLLAHGSMAVALGVLGLALVKGVVVAQDFLELRHAPKLWRGLVLGWLVLVLGLIVLAYWAGLRGWFAL